MNKDHEINKGSIVSNGIQFNIEHSPKVVHKHTLLYPTLIIKLILHFLQNLKYFCNYLTTEKTCLIKQPVDVVYSKNKRKSVLS